jgi:hypothetical protein
MSNIPEKNKKIWRDITDDWKPSVDQVGVPVSDCNVDELEFFKKISVPLVKKIYPTLIANQTVEYERHLLPPSIIQISIIK